MSDRLTEEIVEMENQREAREAEEKKKNRSAFNKAFAEARRRGKMTFSMNGKTYGTRKKGETKEQHKAAMEGKRPQTIAKKKAAPVSSGKKPTLQLRGTSPSPAAAAAPKSKKEVRATKKANDKNTRNLKRDEQRGGSTFKAESAGRAAQRKEYERIKQEKAAKKAKRKGARAKKKAGRLEERLAKLKGKAGLKMVKGKDGKMVPFYAADGKGKMPGGGKMHAKKYGKMEYGGKMMKAEGGNKIPVTNDRRAIKAGMKINYDDPLRYLSPSNRRAAEKMQKEGTLRITGPAGGYLDDATFDQISRRDRRMKQGDFGRGAGSVSGKSGASGAPKAKGPVSLRLAPPVGMPKPPSQGGDRDTRRGTVVGPGGSGTITVRGSQQDPATRDNKVVIDKNTGRMSRN